MSYPEFIVLDIESTGVDSKHDDIIEFSAVKLNAAGEIIDQLDTLVSTKLLPLRPLVVALTGIKDEDFEGQPNLEAVLPKIEAFCGDLPIVGHNISFDVEFLHAKGLSLKGDLLDTLELAQTVLTKQPAYSLEGLCWRFNFPHQPSHRAMADVLATVDLMKFLSQQIADLKAGTRKKVLDTLPEKSWNWRWLFAESSFVIPSEERSTFGAKNLGQSPHITPHTSSLIGSLNQAEQFLPDIKTAETGKINFIETHFSIDQLSLALAHAIAKKPAVLVVPFNAWREIDWEAVGQAHNLKLAVRDRQEFFYQADSELELAKSMPSISATEAKLITKVILWRNEWGSDPSKLYLVNDELYQWEQKFAPIEVKKSQLPEHEKVDLIIATTSSVLELENLARYNIIVLDPLSVEESAMRIKSRTLSLNYFSALVSSRRDFVHLQIRPKDVKLADSLFKILNDVSSKLAALSPMLVAWYAANPPSNVFDRNTELSGVNMTDELRSQLDLIIEDLSQYLGVIIDAKLPNSKSQIEHTEKLIIHLKALETTDPSFRYFLNAIENRFYLDILPAHPDFSLLERILTDSKSCTVLGAGLSVQGRFNYWHQSFGEFNSKVLKDDTPLELLLVKDLPEGDDYLEAIGKFSSQMIANNPYSLVLTGSAYDTEELFDWLLAPVTEAGIALSSANTTKALEKLPDLVGANRHLGIVAYYWWLERARLYLPNFDLLLLGKIPFDPNSRPQAKVMQGDNNGFDSYTIPRTTMKLKEVLHTASLMNFKTLVLADSRLVKKDYGERIIGSLEGFVVIPQTSKELLG
ncbi:MAG: 3'-5' exonuclease [Patescibacteria group bacterium]|jgi:DNA polymerase III epsilon subunit-like protein